ncbi:MAG: penicillin-binding protein 2 [Cyanobacteria bacterium J06560_6]
MASSHRSNARRRSSARRPLTKTPRSTHEAIQEFRKKSPRLRLISVWLVLIFGMVGLTGRLAYLQLVRGDELKAMAVEQQAIQTTPRASRRQLVDRQGNVVAMDRVLYTLYVHPMLFKKPPETVATALEEVLESSTLEDSEQALVQQFAEQESGIKLATDISGETAKRVRSLRLDGLDLLPSPKRTYPQDELYAQVTGYTDLEGVPKEGVELAFQSQLTYPKVEASGTAASLQLVTRDDSRLQLTIDSRLQRIAQENLAAAVAEYKAKRGALIVMDSRTGEILTLAVVPTYNPNEYYDANIEFFKNWAVSDLYEPGSTFKPINVAIALENGTVNASDTIYDEGKIQIGEWPIQNVDFKYIGGRGAISITDVLRYSSNVGMVHIMETLQRSTYYEWLERLGIGDNTGSDLPGETNGQIKEREQFVNSAVEAATTAFGQGFSLTPLQLVQLHGTLANGGKMVTPHVVRGMINSDDELTWTPEERPIPRQVFSPETTRQVLQMMQEVVDDGTGSAAKIDGYQIAGKTGTAQKATDYGAYGDQRITSFVSIAPVSDPRYVILAVVDEPQGENAYGGTVAAPLVKKMLDSLVVLEGVAPDQPVTKPAATDSAEPGTVESEP